MDETPLRIVQISDTHLHSDSEKKILGVTTQESFEAVIKLLKEKC